MAAAACLLVSVALISLLGTFPTEFLSSGVKGSRIANAFIALTRFTGGRGLYGSAGFLALLGALGLFVFYALLSQVRSLFNPVSIADPAVLTFRLPAGTPSWKSRLETALSSYGYRRLSDGPEFIEVQKNLSGKWGTLGVHAGFLLLLLAGWVTWQGADIRETQVKEGELLKLPKERKELRLDKFIVFRHAGSDRPSQYTSRFWLKDDHGKGNHADLSVNHPLKIGRTKIFQMRYRVEIPRAEILVYENGEPVDKVLLEAKKPHALGDGTTVWYDAVIPDFKLTQDGIVSMGNAYERSAMRLNIQGPRENTPKADWIFPAAFGPHTGDADKRRFSISKLHKVHYSGVRVSFDPGLPIACAGFLILIFSAFYSSFVIPRRFRVRWEDKGVSGVRLELDVYGGRDPLGLREEMSRIVREKL